MPSMCRNKARVLTVVLCVCAFGGCVRIQPQYAVLPKGALLLTDAKSGQPIPEALVLVTRHHDRGLVEGPRPKERCCLRDAVVFRNGDEFTLYDRQSKAHLSLLPPGLVVADDCSDSFLVFARGYRPKCFWSRREQYGPNNNLVWRLTPQQDAQTEADFREIGSALTEKVIPAGTFQKWDIEEGLPARGRRDLMTVLLHADLPVDVELTPEARKVVSEFLRCLK